MQINDILKYTSEPVNQFLSFNGVFRMRERFTPHYIINVGKGSNQAVVKLSLNIEPLSSPWDLDKLEAMYSVCRGLTSSGFTSLRVKCDPPRVDWQANGFKNGYTYTHPGFVRVDRILPYDQTTVKIELDYVYLLPCTNNTPADVTLNAGIACN